MQFDNIYNVGVNAGGILYNSYLIIAEKNVLIDTVPKKYCDQLIANISKLTNNIDYIIINHTEADRSGCLKELIELYDNAFVVATVLGLKNLKEQMNCEFNELLAKSNMTLNLDDKNSLQFIITHNINWPDSMMTYYLKKRALFSCDAFSDGSFENGMKLYYDQKLSGMSDYVYSAMNNIRDMEIDVIFPGSGVEICNTQKAIKDYLCWSEPCERITKTVSIIYESNTGNTKKLAERAVKVYNNTDIDIRACDVHSFSKEEILDFIYESNGVIFAAPTEYRNIPQRISDIIMSMNHFKLSNKIFASFGSYGWSGEAPNMIYSILRARHFETFKSPFRYLFSADSDTLAEFDKYILSFYEKVINI